MGIDWRGYGDDDEAGFGERLGFRGKADRMSLELLCSELLRAIVALVQLADAGGVDVESDDIELRSKRHGEREADISKADDANGRPALDKGVEGSGGGHGLWKVFLEDGEVFQTARADKWVLVISWMRTVRAVEFCQHKVRLARDGFPTSSVGSDGLTSEASYCTQVRQSKPSDPKANCSTSWTECNLPVAKT